jgi:hypothetical protein
MNIVRILEIFVLAYISFVGYKCSTAEAVFTGFTKWTKVEDLLDDIAYVCVLSQLMARLREGHYLKD